MAAGSLSLSGLGQSQQKPAAPAEEKIGVLSDNVKAILQMLLDGKQLTASQKGPAAADGSAHLRSSYEPNCNIKTDYLQVEN